MSCVSLGMDVEQTKTALRRRFRDHAKVELLDNWVVDVKTAMHNTDDWETMKTVNCLTSTEYSIDQGGFPDIGPANDGEGGKLGGASNPLHVRQLSVDISELRTGGRLGGLG